MKNLIRLLFCVILSFVICSCGSNRRATSIDKLKTQYNGSCFVVTNCKLDSYDFNKYFKDHPEYQLISSNSYTAMENGLYDTYITSFSYTIAKPSAQSNIHISDDAIKAFGIGLGIVELGMLYGLYLKYAATTTHTGDYEIKTIASPSYAGYVSDSHYYDYGETCTVKATPKSGYTFINWTENGQEVSRNSYYTFTVTEDRTLVANFR